MDSLKFNDIAMVSTSIIDATGYKLKKPPPAIYSSSLVAPLAILLTA